MKLDDHLLKLGVAPLARRGLAINDSPMSDNAAHKISEYCKARSHRVTS